jgi:hypothetical protein
MGSLILSPEFLLSSVLVANKIIHWSMGFPSFLEYQVGYMALKDAVDRLISSLMLRVF